MKLNDFLQDIALGELQGSPAVEMSTYQINPEYVPKIIQNLNRALEYFFSVFHLKDNQVIIQTQSGISHYYLDSHYAVSNRESKSKVKYILDNDLNPFSDDVIKILSVSRIDGFVYPMNDIYTYGSVLIPEYNCVQLTSGKVNDQIVVYYQAKHPSIPLNTPASSTVNINIPDSFRAALQAYVACLFYQNMGGNKHNESNAYYAKFKTLVEELKLEGIGIRERVGRNIKPEIGEWV